MLHATMMDQIVVELVSIKNVALRVLALMKTQVTVMCIVGLEMVIAKME